jgi:hypothetical protein
MTDRVLEWTLALPDIDVDQPTTEVRYFPIPLDLRRAVTAVFSISAKMAANTQTRPSRIRLCNRTLYWTQHLA